MQKGKKYGKMKKSTLTNSMLNVTLTIDQIELITYCLEMQNHEFDEVEQRDYQEILKSFKFASPV